MRVTSDLQLMELLKHKPVVALMHAAVCVVCCCCYSKTQQTGYSDLQCGHRDAITTYTFYNQIYIVYNGVQHPLKQKRLSRFQTCLETKNGPVIPVKHNPQGHKLSSKVVDVDTGKIGNVQIMHVTWRKVKFGLSHWDARGTFVSSCEYICIFMCTNSL